MDEILNRDRLLELLIDLMVYDSYRFGWDVKSYKKRLELTDDEVDYIETKIKERS